MPAQPTQLVMPFAPTVSYQPEDFIHGPANEAAFDLIARWPDWPYSLVVLHGPKGCGKTHLCHVFAAQAQAMFLDPARIGTAPADQLLAGHHCWIIDGLERVADSAALAQLINHARARGDYLLMTASTPPAQLAIALPDLRSRLAALPEIGIALPDDMLLSAVLAKSFADRQLRVAPQALAFAVARLERSFEAAQHFAALVDEASLATGARVNMVLMRQILR
jgi:chromosomal replication initiation ATPase DnaA